MKLHQDALQTPFSVFLDIFYPLNFRCFDENGVFQQPQAITLMDLRTVVVAPVTINFASRNSRGSVSEEENRKKARTPSRWNTGLALCTQVNVFVRVRMSGFFPGANP